MTARLAATFALGVSVLGVAGVARAEPLDPDTWLTPDAVLEGVRQADARFESLRADLLGR